MPTLPESLSIFLVSPRFFPIRVKQALSIHISHILSRDDLSVVERRTEEVDDEHEVGAERLGGGQAHACIGEITDPRFMVQTVQRNNIYGMQWL